MEQSSSDTKYQVTIYCQGVSQPISIMAESDKIESHYEQLQSKKNVKIGYRLIFIHFYKLYWYTVVPLQYISIFPRNKVTEEMDVTIRGFKNIMVVRSKILEILLIFAENIGENNISDKNSQEYYFELFEGKNYESSQNNDLITQEKDVKCNSSENRENKHSELKHQKNKHSDKSPTKSSPEIKSWANILGSKIQEKEDVPQEENIQDGILIIEKGKKSILYQASPKEEESKCKIIFPEHDSLTKDDFIYRKKCLVKHSSKKQIDVCKNYHDSDSLPQILPTCLRYELKDGQIIPINPFGKIIGKTPFTFDQEYEMYDHNYWEHDEYHQWIQDVMESCSIISDLSKY